MVNIVIKYDERTDECQVGAPGGTPPGVIARGVNRALTVLITGLVELVPKDATMGGKKKAKLFGPDGHRL